MANAGRLCGASGQPWRQTGRNVVTPAAQRPTAATHQFCSAHPSPLTPETKCPVACVPTKPTFRSLFIHSYVYVCSIRARRSPGSATPLLAWPWSPLCSRRRWVRPVHLKLSRRALVSKVVRNFRQVQRLHQMKASWSGQSCVRERAVSPVWQRVGISLAAQDSSDTGGKPVAWTVC